MTIKRFRYHGRDRLIDITYEEYRERILELRRIASDEFPSRELIQAIDAYETVLETELSITNARLRSIDVTEDSGIFEIKSIFESDSKSGLDMQVVSPRYGYRINSELEKEKIGDSAEDIIQAWDALSKQLIAYVEGKRSQQDLPFENERIQREIPFPARM